MTFTEHIEFLIENRGDLPLDVMFLETNSKVLQLLDSAHRIPPMSHRAVFASLEVTAPGR